MSRLMVVIETMTVGTSAKSSEKLTTILVKFKAALRGCTSYALKDIPKDAIVARAASCITSVITPQTDVDAPALLRFRLPVP
jgi:hypothetical protein